MTISLQNEKKICCDDKSIITSVQSLPPSFEDRFGNPYSPLMLTLDKTLGVHISLLLYKVISIDLFDKNNCLTLFND